MGKHRKQTWFQRLRNRFFGRPTPVQQSGYATLVNEAIAERPATQEPAASEVPPVTRLPQRTPNRNVRPLPTTIANSATVGAPIPENTPGPDQGQPSGFTTRHQKAAQIAEEQGVSIRLALGLSTSDSSSATPKADGPASNTAIFSARNWRDTATTEIQKVPAGV